MIFNTTPNALSLFGVIGISVLLSSCELEKTNTVVVNNDYHVDLTVVNDLNSTPYGYNIETAMYANFNIILAGDLPSEILVPCRVEIFDEGVMVSTYPFWINTNQFELFGPVFSFSVGYDFGSTFNGQSRRAKVLIDIDGEIREINENNNTFYFQMTPYPILGG
jgi:hypothetical protein